MNEQVISFGEQNQLHGILTNPDNINPELPTILFWNAGLVHKFGVHRIHVNLARRLAQLGFSSIRFDLAGLGDSPNIKTAASYEENVVLNIQQAIDFANHQNGATQAVLIGFCSGALNAHDTITQDSRIRGAVFIDSYAYRTTKFYWLFILKLLTSWKWLGAIKRRLIRLFRAPQTGESAIPIEWEFPPKKRVVDDLHSFVQREIKMYFIYTSDMPKDYNYKNQFFDMFSGIDFNGLLTLDYYSKTDHLFTPLAQKTQLAAGIINWLENNFLEVTQKNSYKNH